MSHKMSTFTVGAATTLVAVLLAGCTPMARPSAAQPQPTDSTTNDRGATEQAGDTSGPPSAASPRQRGTGSGAGTGPSTGGRKAGGGRPASPQTSPAPDDETDDDRGASTSHAPSVDTTADDDRTKAPSTTNAKPGIHLTTDTRFECRYGTCSMTVSNRADSTVAYEWFVKSAKGVASVTPDSGSLAPGASQIVSVTLDSCPAVLVIGNDMSGHDNVNKLCS